MPKVVKTPPSFADKAREAGVRLDQTKPTLWLGPSAAGWNGGITQSMLGKFLVDRERFRLEYIEGFAGPDTFQAALEYGNMWHVCEESHAAGAPWRSVLLYHSQMLARRYPLQQEQVLHWHSVCTTQFPHYVEYWKQHPDVLKRDPLFQEEVFDVRYRLPSSRFVRLRGKFDSVDFIHEAPAGIYLQENKTKSEIDEQSLQKQLRFDLQTMLYLVGLSQFLKPAESRKIRGIRYNVIRRPLAGGEGTIRKHKPSKSNPAGESDAEFYARLSNDYLAVKPESYFARWRIEVLRSDVDKFCRETLDPVLEQLCDWYEIMKDRRLAHGDVFLPATAFVHSRLPYGVYNPIAKGAATPLDNLIDTGSELGLRRIESLFPELK